jgi:hypothetical protein
MMTAPRDTERQSRGSRFEEAPVDPVLWSPEGFSGGRSGAVAAE